MAGLFRKRQFKPWIASCVISKDKNLKSRVVKVLCRRSVSTHGSMVMLVSDGELSISAIFSEQAVDNALSNLGLERDSSWDSALLILHEFTLELKVNPGQDVGDFVLYVEKFNIWDLQPGYHAKFDVKYCMEHTKVQEMMAEEIRDMKEKAACQSQTDKTGSYALTQLLEEMAKPSQSLSQSNCEENNEENTVNFTANKCGSLTESLMELLVQPFKVEEFLIPPLQAEVLQNIPGWKPGDHPQSPVELEGNSLADIHQPSGNSLAASDQQFDICAANTLSSSPEILKVANHERRSKEASQDVTYLGISVTPPEHPDVEVIKSRSQSPGPISSLFKHSNMDSQSQGTSSQWQGEVDSVRFSFEESCTTDTPRSPEESPNPDVENAVESRKHVETVEKPNKHVIKESDGIKPRGTVSPVNIEKGSDEFVTEEIIKEKLCSTVSEKGRKRTGESSIKEIEVLKSGTPVTDQEETFGRPLSLAVSEERHNTPSSKEIQEKVTDEFITKEKRDKRVDKDIVKKNFGVEADNHITKKNIKEKGNTLATKEYSEESFDFGSPDAHSTQIDEVININTKGNSGNMTENVEKLLDNTDENENDFQGINRTKFSEFESVSQNSVHSECTSNISGSQEDRGLIESQNKENCVPTVTDNPEVLVKDENVDPELEAKINSSLDNTPSSALSEVDKSIMLDYYSQNSSSPDRNWNNVLLRLAEKKKKLQALQYVANRISRTADEQDKIEGNENDINWSNNGCIREKRKEDVNSVSADDGRNVKPADIGKARSGVVARDEVGKTVKENLLKQAESTTKGIIVARKLPERGKVIEEGNDISYNDSLDFDGMDTLCSEKDSNLIETNNDIDTEDTGYPLDSLTLRDSCEENDSCLLPSDIVLEQTDLEADDRIHCENIAKYAAEREELKRNSDQSDLEIVGYSSRSLNKNEKNMLSKEKKLSKKDESSNGFEETLHDNPLAPLYFETEYGSKKRSRRLYKKVVSSRQKDDRINSANKGDNSAVSSRSNDNLENSNHGNKVISERMTELFDAGSVSDRPNQDANIERIVITMVTEPPAEAEAHHESSSLNEDVSVGLSCDLRSKSKAEITSPLSVGIKSKCNAKSDEWKTKMWTRLDDNIMKNVSETAAHTKWKFKKDVRIMLERCDRKKTSYVQEDKRSTRSSSKCCNKPPDSENALQKPLASGNALQYTSANENELQKPLENRNSLQKAKVKSYKALRESPDIVSSLAVNIHCESCRSDEEIETVSSQQDHDKAISLLGGNDSSSDSLADISTSSMKLSMKRIKGKFKIVSKRENKRHRHASENILDSSDEDIEVRDATTEKDKAKLKRKKAVLEIVSDSSQESEIVKNSSSDSSKESEIIAYSADVVKFDNNTTEKKDQVLKNSDKFEITELSDAANSSEEISLLSADESSINDSERDKEESEKTGVKLVTMVTCQMDKADKKNKVVTDRIDRCSFEDQFKTWLKKGYGSREKVVDEGRECQKKHSDAGHSVEPEKERQEIENKKNTIDKHSSTEMEDSMESMPQESNKQTDVQEDDIFNTEEQFPNDQSLQPGDQVILSSPVQCTQPFEICPYPATQEFVPKLSETLVQTSVIESQTTCNNESLSRSNISKDSEIPQTQEFVPNLSETLAQKSFMESPETCNNETLNERSTSKDSDKTSRIPAECNALNECLIEATKELERDSTECNLGNIQVQNNLIGKSHPEKIEITGDKQVNVEFQTGQANKKINGDEKENTVHSDLSSVTNKTSYNELFEITSKSSIHLTVDAAGKKTVVSSVDDNTFTKLIKKSESQRLPSDFWAMSKPEKLAFKVKPVKGTDIQRKRKFGYNSIEDMDKIKKQKCTDKEYNEGLKVRNGIKDGLKQKEEVAVVEIPDNLNDSLEDFKVNGSPSKKPKIKKNICEENTVGSDMEHIIKSKNSDKIPIKTYEPRKIFIDGHCFGNRVCWQNFIESPYSAPASGETKNKSDVEKTNKRKSKLDSSQGSQRKSSSLTVGENVNKNENAAVNRSSESLFSAENEENEKHDSSPDSVSLLHSKKVETSVLSSKLEVERYTYPTRLTESVNIKTKNYGGTLKYTTGDGIPRFYREKDNGHDKNMKTKDSESNCLASANSRLRRHQRWNAGINSDTDINLSDKACGNSKQLTSIDKQQYSTEKTKEKAAGKFTSLDKKGPVPNEMIPVDKKLFVEDWLMKHKKIGEQQTSSQELSPPEIQTSGNSLPSHQPAVSAGGQRARKNVQTEDKSFLLHEDSTEEQQGKDNSLNDSSSSKSSDSIASEELNKPMSAAARYLLKFRKARKEKRRKKMLEELQSNMKIKLKPT